MSNISLMQMTKHINVPYNVLQMDASTNVHHDRGNPMSLERMVVFGIVLLKPIFLLNLLSVT